jgi:hypothetical protein
MRLILLRAGALLAASFFVFGGCAPVASAGAELGLDEGFRKPPLLARPSVYWFWVDGNVTREGITADLESMQRAGLGGALLFDVTQDIPKGPVRFASPQWRELFKHAVSEAARLGLELSINNDAGWTGSGGPWISPEHAMQQFVWSKTNFSGPGSYRGPLPPLRTVAGFSRDIATLAFPVLVGDGAMVPGFAPRITASIPLAQPANLIDHHPATVVSLPVPQLKKPQYLQLEFQAPFTAEHLGLTGIGQSLGLEGTIEVSDDGKNFRAVREFLAPASSLALDFEKQSARWYRIVFRKADPGVSKLELAELELGPLFRIPLHAVKTGAGRGKWPAALPNVPSYSLINPTNILDLSSKVNSRGELDWQAPEGEWTILRLGYTPLGTSNHPAPAEGLGLECDKLSREAIRSHFDGFLSKIIGDAGDESGRAFKGVHIDSWEIGYQNWTPHFLQEFHARRGYDALPFLPAFTGRYVQSSEVSERFLWDVRHTIAELLADNYAGGLAELCHQHGLSLSIQAYANGPFDNLSYAGRADQPAAEFWTEKNDFGRFQAAKIMSSAAHTYGKPVVPAEAFTAYPSESSWQNHPFSLKPLGDAMMTQGVNRFFIHRFAHQPWLNRAPGMTMGPWGLNYERTETWWEQSRPWHEYLARCHFLLQRGNFLADLCYLADEGSYSDLPNIDNLNPPLPAGYAFDFISAEAVIQSMSFTNGALRLPDGMAYKLLVLPHSVTMTPELLQKIKQLVEAGATVFGTRPTKSPSLANYPQCDHAVQSMASALWADCDGSKVKEHRAGAGRVVLGKTLDQVLAELGAPPDYETLSKVQGYAPRYLHRHEAKTDTDIYFIANSNAFPVAIDCAFRIRAKQPELWHPDSGATERLASWQEKQGRTILALKLDSCGSVFVVFRPSQRAADPVVALLRNGKEQFRGDLGLESGDNVRLIAFESGDYEIDRASGRKLRARVAELPAPFTLSGSWEVSFAPNWGAPEHVTFDTLTSWTTSTNPGIKYFSGRAVYRKSTIVPESFAAAGRRTFLDLGNVQVIAEVSVNGKPSGILWKPPFELDLTDQLKPGTNLFEVAVVNCWVNRLIGDEQLPDDCAWRISSGGDALGRTLVEWPQWLKEGRRSPTGRLTFATWKYLTRNSPLLESGLLGPVTLRMGQSLTFSSAAAR